MKQFTAQKIITDSDGTIILVGKKGFLRVRRVNDNYSGAAIGKDYKKNMGEHEVAIAEVPISGNIAF